MTSGSSFFEVFQSELEANESSFSPSQASAIETRLNALLADARAVWPDVPLSPEHFARQLAASCSGLDVEDPELGRLKEHYAADFRLAVRGGIAALGRRERTLLRQHFIDGVSLDQLAVLHRVHRATIARWIAQARRTLLELIRASLSQRL